MKVLFGLVQGGLLEFLLWSVLVLNLGGQFANIELSKYISKSILPKQIS